MKFRPIRPPFVLCFAADQQGCGYHRVVMPASALATAGVIDARIDVRLWSEQWLAAMKPDVIVFQRQIETNQIDTIKLARRVLPQAFLVYEIDDPLDAVPDSSHHAGMVPPGVSNRIREALAYCDAASTTTEPMAEWLRELGAKDVRVCPNFISEEKIHRRPDIDKSSKRIRIGWAGGASHDGDLALIVPAMRAIGTKVDWVFFGAQPKGDIGVPIEFHEPVSPMQYQDKLAKLDLDLMLAPLERNFFNECKSNLRLVEAGACSAAAIAQAATPYLEGAPPVSAFVAHGDSWTPAIERFIATPLSQRRQQGAAMRAWVEKHYTFERQMDRRLKAWMPAELPSFFRPGSPGKTAAGRVVVCCPGGQNAMALPPTGFGDAGIVTQIEEAASQAITTGADLLYLRPGTTLSESAWQRMRSESLQDGVATVCVLGSDGPDGFPTRDRFTPAPDTLSAQIGEVAAKLWPNRTANVTVPTGAAILLRAPMLSLLGSPDGIGLDGNTEAALIEWSIRASMRQYRHVQVLDQFVGALIAPPGLTESMATRMRLRGALDVMQAQKPALTAVERETLELTVVGQQWAGPGPGIAPFGSDYTTWRGLQRDRPPQMVDASKVAVAAFGGFLPDAEWIIFIDEHVTLLPGAAAELVAAADVTTQVVYADHEIQTPEGLTPVFKPDYDYELLLARDYVTPVMAIRRGAVEDDVPKARSDLHERLMHEGPELAVKHVPRVLGTIDGTATESRRQRERHARLVAAMEGNAVPHPTIPEAVRVMRVSSEPEPRVTIIIPTLGDGWVLQPCVIPLLRLTTYANYEVLVVHTGESPAPDLGEAADDSRVRWIKLDGPFNWSRINNHAVAQSGGDYLLFLNDDTRVIAPEWLNAMVDTAKQLNVGVVGARLIHQHGTVQHIGVTAHNGLIGHVHFDLPANSPGYLGTAMLTHEALAVTGACMLVSRDTFAKVGGFREDLSHNYNDIAFCIEVYRLGYRNIVECRAELIHLAGATRPGPTSPEGMKRLMIENKIMAENYNEPDPYWNPNFVLMANGVGVQGLGYEMLSWASEPLANRPRVLVINDVGLVDGEAARLTREGATVLMAETTGFIVKMIAPALVVGAWDIREPAVLTRALATLGVERIVLSSLAGNSGAAAGVEMLRGLHRLGLPLEYIARTPEVACPRITLMRGGASCNDGWRNGIAFCQGCINENGSPFGYVDVTAWQTAWAEVIYPQEEVLDAAD